MAWRKPPGTAGQLTRTAVSPRRSGAKGYSRRVPRERKRKLWVNCSVWIFGKLLVYWVFSGKWKWVKKKLSKFKKKKKKRRGCFNSRGQGRWRFCQKENHWQYPHNNDNVSTDYWRKWKLKCNYTAMMGAVNVWRGRREAHCQSP